MLHTRGLETFSKHHGAGQVLNRFFDDIRENEHHGFGLLFRETFIFKTLHKLQGIEMMVASETLGGGEALMVNAGNIGKPREK